MTAPLDLARGLLRPNEDDAERPTTFGYVEEDLLDGRLTFTRRVLVQLVEDKEQKRSGDARRSPSRRRSASPSRRRRTVWRGPGGCGGRPPLPARPRYVPCGVPAAGCRRGSGAREARCDDSRRRMKALMVPIVVAGGAQIWSRRRPTTNSTSSSYVRRLLPLDLPGAVVTVVCAVPQELRGDPMDQHRVLVALVLRFHECERQKLFCDELVERPVVSIHTRWRVATSGPALGSPRRGGA